MCVLIGYDRYDTKSQILLKYMINICPGDEGKSFILLPHQFISK